MRKYQQKSYGMGALAFSALTAVIFDRGLQCIFLLLSLVLLLKYYRATFSPRLPPRVLHHRHRRIDSYDCATFRNDFRFEQRHSPHIMASLGLDSARDVIIPSDETWCNKEEASLILLNRMAKHIDLVTLEQEFGRDNTTLGRIVSLMAHDLVSNNHYLISDNIDIFVPRLTMA